MAEPAVGKHLFNHLLQYTVYALLNHPVVFSGIEYNPVEENDGVSQKVGRQGLKVLFIGHLLC